MVRSGSKLLTIAARVGYGARGIVYLLIGGLAILAAFGLGGQTVGTRGALRIVFAQPSGIIMLAGIAGGLACLAAWRLIQAVVDPAGYGRDARGLGIRLALGMSSLAYIGVAVFSIRLLLGWEEAEQTGPDSVVREWLPVVLDAPFGPWIAAAVGLVVIGIGAMKAVKAWRAEFGEHLECADHIQRWAIPVSRFGLTARGIVFILIGGSVVVAAFHLQANRAAGLASLLGTLEQVTFGWLLLVIAALGLACFGIFGLIEAMYRRIEARDID